MNNMNSIKLIKKIGGLSLIIYPIMLMISFAMHFKTFSDFFMFKLKYVQVPIEDSVRLLMSSQGLRYFIAPHIVAYFAVPFMMFSAVALGYVLFDKKPKTAITGTLLSVIGCIFLGGVFAAWTSFAAIGNFPANQFDSAVMAFSELTTMQGPLAIFSSLSALSLIGFLILAIGLFQSRIISRWRSSSIFLGNLLIIVFMDLDNWMFIGAILILIGIFPIAQGLFHNSLKKNVS